MAFVVRRPKGRFEVRESYWSVEGPRSRTLANFLALSPTVMDRIARTARSPVDRGELIRSAQRAGAPIVLSEEDATAEKLIRLLARGGQVRPGLGTFLAHRLGGRARLVDDAVFEWVGITAQERGTALVQLLRLADRIPVRRHSPLAFPRLSEVKRVG